jgi:hypothetical protein
MAGGKITFYVDIVSPFCYMGYYFLRVGPWFCSAPPSRRNAIPCLPLPWKTFFGFLRYPVRFNA